MIRLSKALKDAGTDISSMPKSQVCADGQGYLQFARNGGILLTKQYGLPEAGSTTALHDKNISVLTANEFINKFKDTRGIIYYEWDNHNNMGQIFGSGHIDLWKFPEITYMNGRTWYTLYDIRIWYWPLK